MKNFFLGAGNDFEKARIVLRGANLFHYLRDPWSSCVEYFADIDYIPEGYNWEPRRYMPGDLPDFWGSSVPTSFNVNFEAIKPNTDIE